MKVPDVRASFLVCRCCLTDAVRPLAQAAAGGEEAAHVVRVVRGVGPEGGGGLSLVVGAHVGVGGPVLRKLVLF